MSDRITTPELAQPLLAELPAGTRLRLFVDKAQHAICSLWENGTFWRSTAHRERESRATDAPEFYPTVSFRSACSLLRLAEDCPDWLHRSVRAQLQDQIVPALVARRLGDFHSTLDTTNGDRADDGSVNLFTLALYVELLGLIARAEDVALTLRNSATKNLNAALTQLVNHRTLVRIRTDRYLSVHPFLLYHVRRALETAAAAESEAGVGHSSDELDRGIREAARAAIGVLLARERLGMSNPGDAVALGFAAGTLADEVSVDDANYVREGVTICLAAQDSRGSWAFGRVVAAEKDIASHRLEIPTYEIAAVMVESLLGLVEGAGSVPRDIAAYIEAVQRAIEHVERSIVRLREGETRQMGWCSDHAYGKEFVESWTSATVLEFVVTTYKLIDAVQRRALLSTFVSVWPTSPDWPSWLRWETYRETAEVDHDHPVLDYVNRRIVEPLRSESRVGHVPLRGSVSALLFGPPGTSKTTIVRGIADGLGWPLVTLSPGDFIERGLEMIEAQARAVFERLLGLSRTVVLFDECDELFRDRAPRQELEQTRSITAFVTASMLPKLQELHDRGRVVFVICTNNFEAMDSAVKRGGRIDHVIAVGPPDVTARRRIISDAFAQAYDERQYGDIEFEEEIKDELAAGTERFTRMELDRLVRAVAERRERTSEDEARRGVREAIDEQREGLIIEANDYAEFQKLQKRHSHAVVAAERRDR